MEKEQDKTEWFKEEILRWNRAYNIVSRRETRETISKLIAVSHELDEEIRKEEGEERYQIDLGTGGGIPSIPICIKNEKARVVSIERTMKKATFQKHIKRALELENLEIVRESAEKYNGMKKQFNCATSMISMKGKRAIEIATRGVVRGGHIYIVTGGEEKELIEKQMKKEAKERGRAIYKRSRSLKMGETEIHLITIEVRV